MKKIIISLLGLAFSSMAFGYIVPSHVPVHCPTGVICPTSKLADCEAAEVNHSRPLFPPFIKISGSEGTAINVGIYVVDNVMMEEGGAICTYSSFG